ncbi:MAG: hypothetical protein ACK4UK_01275 [Flavobacterium sp.]
MKIKIPKDFKSANEEEIKKFYDFGRKNIEENGYQSRNQNNILFLNKGEFSSIKVKYSLQDAENLKDYKNQWESLKKMTFDILTKEKIPEATIDSTSRKENINGINFYVFEKNINFLDDNKNMANFKFLRYSTPLEEMEFVINVKYANRVDEKDLLATIRSIKINKK